MLEASDFPIVLLYLLSVLLVGKPLADFRRKVFTATNGDNVGENDLFLSPILCISLCLTITSTPKFLVKWRRTHVYHLLSMALWPVQWTVNTLLLIFSPAGFILAFVLGLVYYEFKYSSLFAHRHQAA